MTFNERGVWAPKVWAEYEYQSRGARYFNAVARLEPGVTIEQAQSELDGIAERLAQQYPGITAARPFSSSPFAATSRGTCDRR